MQSLAIRLLICGAAIGVLLSAGYAADDGDIVWKTYRGAAYPGDGALTCTGLKNEIARVNGDIAAMDRARSRVEKNIQSAFDLSVYSRRKPMNGTANGPSTGGQGGENELAGVRDKIVASKHVAAERVTYLTQLMVQCKDSPANP